MKRAIWLFFLSVLVVLPTGCAVDPPVDERPFALVSATDLNDDPDIVEVNLTAAEATIELIDGVQTSMWAYNGQVPGPLIEAKLGTRVIIHLRNDLAVPTTIHWHGLRIPAAMDGVEAMQTPVGPGETFTYDFVVTDALLAWYHPHVRSEEAVERGLQAPFVIRDPAATAFGVETIAVLDDILLDGDDQVAPFARGGMQTMSGRLGNTVLVNGHRHPVLTVHRGEPQLLRVVNTANARTMVLKLPNHALTWIGTDGGLLEAPRVVDEVSLSAGERADVLFTLDDEVGTETDLEVGPAAGMGGGMMGGDGDVYKVLRVRVVDGAARSFPTPPATLREIAELSPGRTRTITFDAMGGAGSSMMAGSAMMGFTINKESWPNVTPLVADVGDVETWIIDNRTGMAHPFHLHGNRFQVMEAPGETPPRAWKDNVLVPAHARVRLAVALDGTAGRWMFHCHILEHAENGMMGELDLQ